MSFAEPTRFWKGALRVDQDILKGMLPRGVYPAMVTPFDERGRVDEPGLARLLAHFEASGCTGVVLAGTNGEGPSLSAAEKRDMILRSGPWSGKLLRILGIATPSLEEAIWSTRRAQEGGASAVLVMAPSYFRSASEIGIRDWFLRLMDGSPVGVLAYNFPKMTGFTMTPEFLVELAQHPQFIGAKDSSGEAANLVAYRQAIRPEHNLFVGDETLLIQALEAGWSGSISGAANSIPEWISRIVQEWFGEGLDPETDWKESAITKFELVVPIIRALRAQPQPATHKGILKLRGVLDSARLRLPLLEADPQAVEALFAQVSQALGIRRA